jgi:hypothetical protein
MLSEMIIEKMYRYPDLAVNFDSGIDMFYVYSP